LNHSILGVSFTRVNPPAEKVLNLTFGNLTAEERKISRSTFDWKDIVVSVFVVVVVIFVMLLFNGK